MLFYIYSAHNHQITFNHNYHLSLCPQCIFELSTGVLLISRTCNNCLVIINHRVVYGLNCFPRLPQRTHGGCERSAEDVHSSVAPVRTCNFMFCWFVLLLFCIFPLNFNDIQMILGCLCNWVLHMDCLYIHQYQQHMLAPPILIYNDR